MPTPSYRLLSWDREFLGFPVARIAAEVCDETSVTRVLRELRDEGVRVAYWQPKDSERVRNFAREAGATYVGTQLRFNRATESAEGARTDLRLERCAALTPELEALGVAAGAWSRFALDPAMPEDTAARLYTIWVRESFGGTMGDEVLAARDASGIAGLVTLKREAGAGVIGLVAVSERCRGAGVGRFLVNSATARFAALGIGRVSVVTQGENTAACRLYEGCGYALADSSVIAHFWL